jgi:hypothetical protein
MAKAINTADSASRPDPILPMTMPACPLGRVVTACFPTRSAA